MRSITVGLSCLRPLEPFRIRTEPARAHHTRIILTVPTGWAQAITRGLDALTGLTVALRRQEQAIARQRRVSGDIAKDRAFRRRILKKYLTLRRSGLLHRQAIRELVADPSLQSLGWDFSIFNRVLPPASAYRPQTHRAIPSPPQLRLLRSALKMCDIHTFAPPPSISSASTLKLSASNGVSQGHPIPVGR